MVFVVSPSRADPPYVRPLARSFRDFLRLILAVGSATILEQIPDCDEMCRAGTATREAVSPKQQAVLDAIQQTWSLRPMPDPYGYIRSLQKRSTRERFVFPGPEKAREMGLEVTVGGFFSSESRQRPGREVAVGKRFTWEGQTWRVPSLYLCPAGLVVDLCLEADAEQVGAYRAKWAAVQEKRRLSRVLREQMEAGEPVWRGGPCACGTEWNSLAGKRHRFHLLASRYRGQWNQQPRSRGRADPLPLQRPIRLAVYAGILCLARQAKAQDPDLDACYGSGTSIFPRPADGRCPARSDLPFGSSGLGAAPYFDCFGHHAGDVACRSIA
jgi:hypothetical protein